jgi:lysozyme
MKVSERCKEMVKHHEGVRFKPYRCPARLWTVGVGHVLYPAQGRLPLDQRDAFPLAPEDNRAFSKAEVDGTLSADLIRFETGVARLLPLVLTQNQVDALVSFSFNLGLGRLQGSTLRSKVLRREMEAAADEFLKFTRGGGKILPGLVKRRNDERALFLGA